MRLVDIGSTEEFIGENGMDELSILGDFFV